MKKKRKVHINKPVEVLVITFLSVTLLVLGFLKITSLSSPTCANSISCINDLSGDYSQNTLGYYMSHQVQSPQLARSDTSDQALLGATTSSKHIFVDLSIQHLYAYEDNKLVYDFLVSSGKSGKTPTGDFTTWIKLKYTRMAGGSKANGTFYDLPNVPYTMYFYNDKVPKSMGYGLHGAYWHHNFGHPMSHGCINLSPENSRSLYEWANPPSTSNVTYATPENPGTPLTIYGVAPL